MSVDSFRVNRREVSRLELILGPMMAGKSTELRRHLKLKSLYKNVVAVTPIKDSRYGDGIRTHDGHVFPSIAVEKLEQLIFNPEYMKADVVGIDEGQFFPEIPEFIRQELKNTDKTFIISGLDGDKNKKFFGTLHELIPEADRKVFLLALCTRCADGTEAPFTIERKTFDGQEKIGGTDDYEAVCRSHYDQLRNELSNGYH